MKRRSLSPEEVRRQALDLEAAKQKKKAAQTRFYRELEKYMRSSGSQATAQDVLRSAEQIWHANEMVRKLQPPQPARDGAAPARRPPPKRMTGVVSGGLPGQKRRK